MGSFINCAKGFEYSSLRKCRKNHGLAIAQSQGTDDVDPALLRASSRDRKLVDSDMAKDLNTQDVRGPANGDASQESATRSDAQAKGGTKANDCGDAPPSSKNTKSLQDTANGDLTAETARVDVFDESDLTMFSSPDKFVFVCNGDCGPGQLRGVDAYICKECVTNVFCPECAAKLTAASLHEKVCHQEHDRLYISQIDLRKFELSPSNHVMVVGDLLMSRKEWLGSIKKEWELEDKTLSPKDRWIMAVRKVNLMNVKPLRSSSGLSNRNCLRRATSK